MQAILYYRRDQHDQRDVQGEASGRPVLVDRVYLVREGGHRRGDDE